MIRTVQGRGEYQAKLFKGRVYRASGAGKVIPRKITGSHKPMRRTDRESLCRKLESQSLQGS